jgi:hypothetical protein
MTPHDIEHELEAARPAPPATWRGALGRRLAVARQPPARPSSLRAWIAALAVGGAVLLGIAVTQI